MRVWKAGFGRPLKHQATYIVWLSGLQMMPLSDFSLGKPLTETEAGLKHTGMTLAGPRVSPSWRWRGVPDLHPQDRAPGETQVTEREAQRVPKCERGAGGGRARGGVTGARQPAQFAGLTPSSTWSRSSPRPPSPKARSEGRPAPASPRGTLTRGAGTSRPPPFRLLVPSGPAQSVVMRDVQVPLRKTPPDSRLSGGKSSTL